MTGSLDPWRTLGLAPGAPLDEIHRAYRRLAKANHPDAAGESALPRFLAIQSAYELLAGPRRSRRPGARPGASTSGEPWRADPARARETGPAEGRRRPQPGSRPGRGSAPRSNAAPGSGPAASSGPSPGPAAGPAAGPASRPGAGGDRAAPGRTSAGSRPGGAEPGGSRRTGGRRRPPNRATPGSTSYDAADEEPFEPGWSGGTWYGASSGTYWTINPKEYADPRKHGPEYQRRARRSASGGWIVDDEPGGGSEDAPIEPPNADNDVDDERRTGRTAAGPAASTRAWARPTQRTEPDAEGRMPGDHPRSAPERGPGAEEPGKHGPQPRAGRPGRRIDEGLAEPLLRPPTTAAGRLGLALLGWPPIGLAVATAIGESTGCGRFSASCAEAFSPGTWIVQAAILLLLLALPRLAGWSAVGTLVALGAAVPTAVVLTAGGASREPEASAGILVGALGLAYVAGVAWAIARRWWPGRGDPRVPWRR